MTNSSRRMQLHGGPISPFVRKVSLCILEKGVEEQVQRVRSPTSMLAPNHPLMDHNPLSKIPTLILEDGSALYDSDVICDYLDFRFPAPPLLPARAQSWRVRRWNALASGALDALVLYRFERNRALEQQNRQVLDSYAVKLKAILERIESEIGDLEMQSFGMAHISLGALFGYLDFRFGDVDWRGGHGHCAAWFEAFMQRASAQRTIPYEGTLAPPGHFWP